MNAVLAGLAKDMTLDVSSNNCLIGSLPACQVLKASCDYMRSQKNVPENALAYCDSISQSCPAIFSDVDVEASFCVKAKDSVCDAGAALCSKIAEVDAGYGKTCLAYLNNVCPDPDAHPWA